MFNGYICKNKDVSPLSLKDLKSFTDRKTKFWLDFKDITQEQINKITKFIELHPVTIEDLKGEEETTRIKYEQFDDYTFIVLSGIKKTTKDTVEEYIVYYIVGKNFLITVHKEDNKIIEDLKNKKRKLSYILSNGADYLLHYLIDQEVDVFYPIVENLNKT